MCLSCIALASNTHHWQHSFSSSVDSLEWESTQIHPWSRQEVQRDPGTYSWHCPQHLVTGTDDQDQTSCSVCRWYWYIKDCYCTRLPQEYWPGEPCKFVCVCGGEGHLLSPPNGDAHMTKYCLTADIQLTEDVPGWPKLHIKDINERPRLVGIGAVPGWTGISLISPCLDSKKN